MANQIVLPRRRLGFNRGCILVMPSSDQLVIPGVGIFTPTGSTPPPATATNQVTIMCVT